ncbi:MAG: MFS transporter [Anaerolineae bacterium]|nr:MFS transporter [Anaerolineae bacterium]
MDTQTRPTGMRAFILIWIGQVVSLLGSAMTGFALSIWAWDLTGEATALALVGFFNFMPIVLFSPIAGALVDRWNRKLVMMISDLAAGLSTVAIFLLFNAGQLQIWHLYLAGLFSGMFQAFQFPAYSASISLMLPKEQYARASGMMSLAESASGIFAPSLAAALLAFVGLRGVLLFDIISFVFAVSMLFLVHIPQPVHTEAGKTGKGSLLKESVYGFKYIWARPSLLGLQMMFFMANLFGTMAMILVAPMVLARTDSNEQLLGLVQSAGAVGGVIGGLIISIWGGPKQKVLGVLLSMFGNSILGSALMGISQHLILWMIAGFSVSFFISIMNASNQAIWQAKVAPDVQGRVFATRRLIAQITAPVAMLMAGPLADNFFAPNMMPNGAWSGALGGIFGVGAGAGIGLLIFLSGMIGAGAALSGFAFPFIRNAERILPDHDIGIAEEAKTT